jgi:signal transduction histidine kinase
MLKHLQENLFIGLRKYDQEACEHVGGGVNVNSSTVNVQSILAYIDINENIRATHLFVDVIITVVVLFIRSFPIVVVLPQSAAQRQGL